MALPVMVTCWPAGEIYDAALARWNSYDTAKQNRILAQEAIDAAKTFTDTPVPPGTFGTPPTAPP